MISLQHIVKQGKTCPVLVLGVLVVLASAHEEQVASDECSLSLGFRRWFLCVAGFGHHSRSRVLPRRLSLGHEIPVCCRWRCFPSVGPAGATLSSLWGGDRSPPLCASSRTFSTTFSGPRVPAERMRQGVSFCAVFSSRAVESV